MMNEMNSNYIKKLSIQGFRGFKEKQEITFAYPSKSCKSGLNIIVGQNCSGKSTILEVIMLLMNSDSKGYYLSRTMKSSENNINIIMENMKCITTGKTSNNRNFLEINTENTNTNEKNNLKNKNYFLVPSRKNVNKNNLYNYSQDIDRFIESHNYNSNQVINRRNNMNNEFISVLTTIYKDQAKKESFDKILQQFFPEISWDLHASDEQENSFVVSIKDSCGETYFEGVGDGIITILYIAVGLFFLEENFVSVLLIDEPEVSLHTEIIKRIRDVLSKYAKKYQIIVATHSPYLIDWEEIKSGGKLIRTVNENKIEVYELDNTLINDLILEPSNNPHIYGTTAKEVFFLKDKIILVEGQEDVICYKQIIKKLNLDEDKYNFYGWGAGGNNNMLNIMKILRSEGYKKIVAIFDGDESSIKEAQKCEDYINDDKTQYKIINIKEHDIRDKYITIYDEETLTKKCEKIYKEGICDKKYKIKNNFDSTYKAEMIELFEEIDQYFET